MKRLFLAGITLASSLVGCAADEATDDCQPGDIDCSTDGGGGKADGWNSTNDPAQMAQHLQYTLSKLPKKGWRDKAVWRSDYPEAVGKAATVWAETRSYFQARSGRIVSQWPFSASCYIMATRLSRPVATRYR